MRVSPDLVILAVGLLPSLLTGNSQPTDPAAQRADSAPVRRGPNQFRFINALGGTPDFRAKNAPPGDPVRLTKPFGITVDEAGHIFIADPGQRSVLVYDQEKGIVKRWNGDARISLSGPVGVAMHDNGRVFVADGYRPQVVVLEASGQPVATFGRDALKRPRAIAVDSRRDRVYVADTKLNSILVFSAATFKLEKVIGNPAGTAETDRHLFSSPSHLALDSKGNLYISDMWVCRIQVFGPDGEFLRSFMTRCKSATEYDRPRAIAIDRQDRVYVADPQDNSVEIFEADGKPVKSIAGLKGRDGTSCIRAAIAIDRNNRIYLAEQLTGEGRVQIFERNRDRR